MLRTVRLKNFRSFRDTGSIGLRRVNILIGANNAGKSAFLSSVELFLRSMGGSGTAGPLLFEEMPAFASFDSVLRRHWSPSEQRPHEFTLAFDWSPTDGMPLSYEFTVAGRARDNTAYVSRAAYRRGSLAVSIRPKTRTEKYSVRIGDQPLTSRTLLFLNLLPVDMRQPAGPLAKLYRSSGKPPDLEVVSPYRPVPRSFYVLDDPGLGTADRELLAFLIRVWSSDDPASVTVRQRIQDNLKILGLARQFDVVQPSRKRGPKVIELRVAPTIRRQRVTIADAGFGLSQALPLVTAEARLADGSLIAYQPEVHLHPYAQSRLADLLTRSAGRRNQIFVETHSPDLILRLQKMVVSSEVDADEIRVLCFENRKGSSRITPVDFNSKGVPGIPWPAGFLDTSLTLARDLAAERSKRTADVS